MAKSNGKSGIQLPIRTGIHNLSPDKADMNFAEQQLKQGTAPEKLTNDQLKFINEVAPQKRVKKINEKTSNSVYASMPIAVERTDLEMAAKILEHIPKDIGRKRPDFSIRDYIRLALKNQIKKDQKIIKRAGKITHSRRSLTKS